MTAVQRLKDKAAQQELEREQAGAAAAKTMQLIDRFMRIVGKEPIKMDKRRLERVWDLIEWWNEKSFPRAVPDDPLQELTLYGQYNNSMDFYGDANGIRAKFGLGVSHPITEDEVLESIVGRLIHYGVPEDVLERAELQARKEQNDQAVAKVRVEQSESRMRHTIAALALDVGSHAEFGELTDMWCNGDRSFLDIQMAARDIAVAVEEAVGDLWVDDTRDFIEDIETLSAMFVRGSIEERTLMSPQEAVRLLKSSGYETYAGLRKELSAMTIEQLSQTVTVEVEDEFYPVKQVKVVTGSDVLDDGHVVLSV